MWKLVSVLLISLLSLNLLAQDVIENSAGLLIKNRADPWVYRAAADSYYFTASVPEFDRIELRHSSSIKGLAKAEAKVIWRKKGKGPMSANIWAPEIHQIDGSWYIYFAAGKAEELFHIRTYVLKNSSADPFQGQWQELGPLNTGWDSFNLDATHFEHQGQHYLIWAQQDKKQSYNSALWIAKMRSATELELPATLLTEPTLDWETLGYKVNEGPAVLIKNDKVWLAYSASATDHRYAMGLLSAPTDADLLKTESWTKATKPVFSTNDSLKRFGPGHNSFVLAPDGVTHLMLYHARDYKEIQGNPLQDGNRHTRVRPLYWTAQGQLDFAQDKPD